MSEPKFTPGAFGHSMPPRNPAGSKLVRRFYYAKHGVRATYAQAQAWYAGYLADLDARVRGADEERRQDRALRRAGLVSV